VLQDYIALFNQLPGALADNRLETLTSAAVRFIDPFNDVTGQAGLRAVLEHFSANVRHVRFSVRHTGWDGDVCLLRWDFSGELPRLGHWAFPGVSEIHIDRAGRICLHRDHWDAGAYFYRKLPLLGTLIGWVRRRLRVAGSHS
jgi:limonene-1,2-epoxide hydrolase